MLESLDNEHCSVDVDYCTQEKVHDRDGIFTRTLEVESQVGSEGKIKAG